MKYAVPVVDGKMSQHFGHCQIFSLFEVDEQSKTITGREDLPSPEHQPGVLPVWLADQGASVILSGGMGPHAQQLFQSHGVKVVTGVVESDPQKAVLDHINGNLSTDSNTCNHKEGDSCNH